jgi:(p)ppGpp synthase/HD superfamily hydrolase
MNLVEKAERYAAEAHKLHVRKFTGEPYITHPAEVVAILKEFGEDDPDVLAAGWLHDVVEDCPGYTIDRIAADFNPEVAALVKDVTGNPRPAKETKEEKSIRKLDDAYRLGHAVPKAKNLKAADMLSNLRAAKNASKDFLRGYLPNKVFVLGALGAIPNRALYEAVWGELREAKKYL